MPAPLIGITTHPATSPHRASLDALLDGIVRGSSAPVVCAAHPARPG